jgi:hypothetical protein
MAVVDHERGELGRLATAGKVEAERAIELDGTSHVAGGKGDSADRAEPGAAHTAL